MIHLMKNRPNNNQKNTHTYGTDKRHYTFHTLLYGGEICFHTEI